MLNETLTPTGCKSWFMSNACLDCEFTPNSVECNNYVKQMDFEKVYS